MKKLLATVLFGTLFSVSAMAGEATILTGKALDEVTAGVRINIGNQKNSSRIYQRARAEAYGGNVCAFCAGVYQEGNATAVASNSATVGQANVD